LHLLAFVVPSLPFLPTHNPTKGSQTSTRSTAVADAL
jgi:hypothetical protein